MVKNKEIVIDLEDTDEELDDEEFDDDELFSEDTDEEFDDEEIPEVIDVTDEEFVDSFLDDGEFVTHILHVPLTDEDLDELLLTNDENVSLVEHAYLLLCDPQEEVDETQYVDEDDIELIVHLPLDSEDIEYLNSIQGEDETLVDALYRTAFIDGRDVDDIGNHVFAPQPKDGPSSGMMDQLMSNLNDIPLEKKIDFLHRTYTIINTYGLDKFLAGVRQYASAKLSDFGKAKPPSG